MLTHPASTLSQERITSFVKLRRGILEHIPHRLSADEFCIYALIILLADHRTGAWRGCAQAMARRTAWSIRQCQTLLKSLRVKGYITGKPSTGRGQYMIKVVKYFEKKAHGGAPCVSEGAPGCALPPKKAHGDATYQEVKQEESILQEKSRVQKPHTVHQHRSEQEQRRIVEARDYRLLKEEEVRKEIAVGRGPECDTDLRQQIALLARAKSL